MPPRKSPAKGAPTAGGKKAGSKKQPATAAAAPAAVEPEPDLPFEADPEAESEPAPEQEAEPEQFEAEAEQHAEEEAAEQEETPVEEEAQGETETQEAEVEPDHDQETQEEPAQEYEQQAEEQQVEQEEEEQPASEEAPTDDVAAEEAAALAADADGDEPAVNTPLSQQFRTLQGEVEGIENQIQHEQPAGEDMAARVGGEDADLVRTIRLFRTSALELFLRYATPAAEESEEAGLTLDAFELFTGEYSLAPTAGPVESEDDGTHVLTRGEVKAHFLAPSQGGLDSALRFEGFICALVAIADVAYVKLHADEEGLDAVTDQAKVKEFFAESLGLFEVEADGDVVVESEVIQAPAAEEQQTEAASAEEPQDVESQLAEAVSQVALEHLQQVDPTHSRTQSKSSLVVRSAQQSHRASEGSVDAASHSRQASKSTLESQQQSGRRNDSQQKSKHPSAASTRRSQQAAENSPAPSNPVSSKSSTAKKNGSKIPAPGSAELTVSTTAPSRKRSPEEEDKLARSPSRLKQPRRIEHVSVDSSSASPTPDTAGESRTPLSPLINTRNMKQISSPTSSGMASRLSPPSQHAGHAILSKLAMQLQLSPSNRSNAFSPTGSSVSEPPARGSYAATAAASTSKPSVLPSILGPTPSGGLTREQQQLFLATAGTGKNGTKKSPRLSSSPPMLAPIHHQPKTSSPRALVKSESEAIFHMTNGAGGKKGKKGKKGQHSSEAPYDPQVEERALEKALEKDLKMLNTKLFHQVSLLQSRKDMIREAEREERQAQQQKEQQQQGKMKGGKGRRDVSPEKAQPPQQQQDPSKSKKKDDKNTNQQPLSKKNAPQQWSDEDITPLPSVRGKPSKSTGSHKKQPSKSDQFEVALPDGKRSKKSKKKAQQQEEDYSQSTDGFEVDSPRGRPAQRDRSRSRDPRDASPARKQQPMRARAAEALERDSRDPGAVWRRQQEQLQEQLEHQQRALFQLQQSHQQLLTSQQAAFNVSQQQAAFNTSQLHPAHAYHYPPHAGAHVYHPHAAPVPQHTAYYHPPPPIHPFMAQQAKIGYNPHQQHFSPPSAATLGGGGFVHSPPSSLLTASSSSGPSYPAQVQQIATAGSHRSQKPNRSSRAGSQAPSARGGEEEKYETNEFD